MATPLNNSVLRAFDILDLITPERREITARTVISELGLNAATAHRFLASLTAIGALASYRRGVYCLGHHIQQLGNIEQETNPLSLIMKPILAQLSQDLYESVMVCRLTRAGPICMAVCPSSRPINVNMSVGALLPLHSTGQGKLWLSSMSRKDRDAFLSAYNLSATTERTIRDRDALEEELERIRARGYATNLGENEPELAAVSVPIQSPEGDMILSLSSFGAFSRFDETFIPQAARRLQRAARDIAAKLR